jgi:cytochrome P450
VPATIEIRTEAGVKGSTWQALLSNLADPYPVYRELRSEGTVLRAGAAQWFVTGHAEAVRAMRDPRAGVDVANARRGLFGRPAEGSGADQPGSGDAAGPVRRQRPVSFLRLDPPDHTRLRNLVSKAFTPRVIQDLRPFVEKTVAQLLDATDGQEEIDVVAALAYPLPVAVICHLLGVPPEDRTRVTTWSHNLTQLINPPSRRHIDADLGAELIECRNYFQALISERRRDPRDDLLTSLAYVEEDGRLTDRELLSTVILLLVAGFETTVNLIAGGTLALIRNPDQRQRLLDDPTLIETAVEELLRFDAPVHIFTRFALEDLELGDKRIRRGSELVVLPGAANRDPLVFEDPDRLDLGRQDNRHVAFGGGIHYCLGASLARLEGQLAIQSLVTRYPNMDLASGELEWGESLVRRGLKRLPVRV